MKKTYKNCSKCRVLKPIKSFAKRSDRPGKYVSACYECEKERSRIKYKKYKEKYAEKAKEWRSNHSHKLKTYKAKYLSTEKGKQKTAEYRKKYVEKNRDKINFLASKYRSKVKKAVPKWLTEKMKIDMEVKYLIATTCTKASKGRVVYHVDHIVPLQGKNVCGLHVPWNLQILTAKDNITKNNKLEVKNASGL